MTNGGPFHQDFERALCEYLGVEHIALFTNGTIALVTALQALRITGEVITTPYSFVATSHSLLWNGIKPVFVDIEPGTLNLDPDKIEAAITPHTTAIMPVHCYGHPCDVDAIQKIADTYNLKVIYDAAHAFGVQGQGGSILNHGDLSVMSFHATKVFNTFEGGAIVCPDEKTKERIDKLKNFGHVGEVTVVAPGINGKMSEFNAALGLLAAQVHRSGAGTAQGHRRCLPRASRGRQRLAPAPPTAGRRWPTTPISRFWWSRRTRIGRDELYDRLKRTGIHPRRYFYPLISEFPMYRGLPSAHRDNLPVAAAASSRGSLPADLSGAGRWQPWSGSPASIAAQ